jgi:hypothetical protein
MHKKTIATTEYSHATKKIIRLKHPLNPNGSLSSYAVEPRFSEEDDSLNRKKRPKTEEPCTPPGSPTEQLSFSTPPRHSVQPQSPSTPRTPTTSQLSSNGLSFVTPGRIGNGSFMVVDIGADNTVIKSPHWEGDYFKTRLGESKEKQTIKKTNKLNSLIQYAFELEKLLQKTNLRFLSILNPEQVKATGSFSFQFIDPVFHLHNQDRETQRNVIYSIYIQLINSWKKTGIPFMCDITVDNIAVPPGHPHGLLMDIIDGESPTNGEDSVLTRMQMALNKLVTKGVLTEEQIEGLMDYATSTATSLSLGNSAV